MSTRAKVIWTMAVLIAGAAFVVNEFHIHTWTKGVVPATTTLGVEWLDYTGWRVTAWIGAICALGIYSFLIKENPVYRFFEHLLLGTAMGFTTAVLYQETIVLKFFWPVVYAAKSIMGHAAPGSADTRDIVLILPFVVGMLWYFQFSKKYLWLSRIAMAVSIGTGAGLGFKGLFNQLTPQITESFRKMAVFGADGFSWSESLTSLVFIVATGSVLTYFFFAFEQKNRGVQGSARLGRWFLMIALGAFFGNTFMSRLSALIERFRFFVEQWIGYNA